MKKNKGRIIFRADADTQTGFGHFVRCGALAEILSDEWQCILYTRCKIHSLIKESGKHYHEIVQLPDNVDFFTEAEKLAGLINDSDTVVLDGYMFDTGYQTSITLKGATLVCIDDIHAYPFNAETIINTAGGISPFSYKANPFTQYFLGPGYTLIRKPFLERKDQRKRTPENTNVFICMGGADPNNDTLAVIDFLSGKEFGELHIVVGTGYQFLDELKELVKKKNLNARIYVGLNASKLAEVMSDCSYGICSPSTVSYEYMTVGGVTYLRQIASNQADMLNYLISNGLGFHLEDFGKTSKEDQVKSLQQQAVVFDGQAGLRLISIFDKLEQSKRVCIRRVTADDMKLCFDWGNDPEVREQSYNNAPLVLEDHKKWFSSKLSDPNSYFYILEWEKQPFAQIRFQVKEKEAVLGYLISSDFRGKGFGAIILSKGLEKFTVEYKKAIDISGFVKYNNVPSQRSFERLQFHKEVATEFPASYKYTMIYDGN